MTAGFHNNNIKVVISRDYTTKLPCNNIHTKQRYVALRVRSGFGVPYYEDGRFGLVWHRSGNNHSLYVVSWYTIQWDFEMTGLSPNTNGKYLNYLEFFAVRRKYPYLNTTRWNTYEHFEHCMFAYIWWYINIKLKTKIWSYDFAGHIYNNCLH